MSIKKQFTKRQIQKTIQTRKKSPPNLDQRSKYIENRLIEKLRNHKLSQNSASLTKPVKQHKSSKNLKIIAVGGFNKVGKNCIAIEYGNDIVLLDLGFEFPDSDMLGIDYVLPDMTYFIKNKHKLRGLFISHGHLDHTGGIPYLIPQLGNIPIFGTRLTIELIKKRLEEFPDITASLKTINPEHDKIQLGCFKLEFLHMNHSIPDAISTIIHTPEGTIFYTGDFKIDFTPATDKRVNLQKIASFSQNGILALISESTNAHKNGLTISEQDIGKNLDTVFSKCKGRIIIATFSSLLSRIQQIFNSAHKHGRKVTFAGRSMLQNFEIATRLKYYQIPRNILISPREIKNHPDHEIVVIATGSQGQENSAIGRMSTGNHNFIQLKKGDTVILSSRPIPGNEKSVYTLFDNLVRHQVNIIHDENMDVHSSGHGYSHDLKIMISLLQPKYLIPDHGSLYARYLHAQIGQELGIPEENTLLLNNGQIAEFYQGKLVNTQNKIPSGMVFVDGLGVGDVGNVVLRDRQQLAEDGIFVIIAQIRLDGTPTEDKNIDIISRGFVYMKGADHLINAIRKKIITIINHRSEKLEPDLPQIRNSLRDQIGEFVFEKTQRRPMIIPFTIEV